MIHTSYLYRHDSVIRTRLRCEGGFFQLEAWDHSSGQWFPLYSHSEVVEWIAPSDPDVAMAVGAIRDHNEREAKRIK